MSHKSNQNLSEIKDKKIPMNGDDKKENDTVTETKEVKQDVSKELTTVMMTRSSKKTTTQKITLEENDTKTKKVESTIEQINEDKKEEVELVLNVNEKKESEEEGKTEEVNGSRNSPVETETSVDSLDNLPESNGHTENNPDSDDIEHNSSKEEFILDTETFMEPLVLQPDEPCPELEFEESSDKESEKSSPVLLRCITRRSQNRKIPTPNTPRSIYEPEPEKDQIDSEKGSDTPVPRSESSSKYIHPNDMENTSTNVSMTVQVGGNDTRLDFSEGESDLLQSLRSKDSNSGSRYLSSRRSLRSLRSDVNSKSLRDSLHRSKLYQARESMERAPSVKRKERSETPEERKKIKTDSTGFLSKFSSPLTNLKNKFTSSPSGTSTPKLTSYKDEKNQIDGDYFEQKEMPEEGVADTQNKWCEIM